MKFYYNKLKYLHDRYNLLYTECKDRGFNVQNYNGCFTNLPENLYKDWVENKDTRSIVIERINNRLKDMKAIKYYGKDIKLSDIKINF